MQHNKSTLRKKYDEKISVFYYLFLGFVFFFMLNSKLLEHCFSVDDNTHWIFVLFSFIDEAVFYDDHNCNNNSIDDKELFDIYHM